MSLLVVGSTAFDTIETPHGTAKECLGGSSTYFCLAARLFTPVRLVSVVGSDFPAEHRRTLESRGIDLSGVETKAGKTFRWHGRYAADMNSRQTLDVQLNTFGDFKPKVPPSCPLCRSTRCTCTATPSFSIRTRPCTSFAGRGNFWHVRPPS